MTFKRAIPAFVVAAGLLALAGRPGIAQEHAHETPEPPAQKWSFAGPFGKFDRGQLQRGFKVYREVCANCHSLSLVSFRNLFEKGGPEFTEAQAQTVAGEFKVKDGPNDQGEMFDRPGRLADHFPPPFPNERRRLSARSVGNCQGAHLRARSRAPADGSRDTVPGAGRGLHRGAAEGL